MSREGERTTERVVPGAKARQAKPTGCAFAIGAAAPGVRRELQGMAVSSIMLCWRRRVAGAAVAKLAYAVGLKSTGVFPVVGSTPTSRTIRLPLPIVQSVQQARPATQGFCESYREANQPRSKLKTPAWYRPLLQTMVERHFLCVRI